MTNKPQGVIYIGITDNLQERVNEQKLKVYQIHLRQSIIAIYYFFFEEWNNGFEASIREKQFKKWKRDWNFDFNKIRK